MLSTVQSFFSRNISTSAAVLVRVHKTWKLDKRIPQWVRPEKTSSILPENSGDLSVYRKPDQTQFLLNYDKSEELKTADDLVKRMFTLENNPRKYSVHVYRESVRELVRRHDTDNGSMENRSERMI